MSDLDARQLRAIHLYLADPNKSKVAKRIGIAPKTLSRWFQNPVFIAEYRRQLNGVQLDLWTRLIGAKDQAWLRLLSLMTDSEPPISLRATTWLLDRLLSSPRFLEGSEARQTGIAAELEARERELLELVGALGRSAKDAYRLDDLDDSRRNGATEDSAVPQGEDAGGTEQ